jgi:DNA-binding LytR/AlgR family response regulator
VRGLLPPLHPVLRSVIAATAATVSVSVVLTLIAVAMAMPLHDMRHTLTNVAGVFVICLCFEAVGEVMGRPLAAPAPPRLIGRLPWDKRGALIALSVTDHYVHVTTTRGHEMLLMRLSDAITEADPTPGLQVHRSHWVALAAIATARRHGDGAVIGLTNGTEVPVSRGFLPAVLAAGLLPRARG